MFENAVTENDYKNIQNLINNRNLVYKDVINFVIESKNPQIIHRTTVTIAKKEDIPRLTDAICETNNAEYIYSFAVNVKDAPIDKLAEAICKTNNAEYIYSFAINVNGAPIDKLAEAICETLNAKYIYYFAKYVKKFPMNTVYINKLAEAISKTYCKDYIMTFIINFNITCKRSLNRLIDALICKKEISALEEILNKNIIKDIDVLKKIKYYIQKSKSPKEQRLDLFRSSCTGKFSDFEMELLWYIKFHGNKKYNPKTKALKEEENKFTKKKIKHLNSSRN